MNSYPVMALLNQKLDAAAEIFRPAMAHWEVTHRCNASCRYCFVRDNQHPDLPTDSMLRIADMLAENKILFVTISGGEPFLRPDILTIFERVIANNFLWIALMTNGLLVEQRHIDFIGANKRYFENVQLSAFSHHPAINDQYFGVAGALDKILAVGRAFLDMGLPVGIALNLFDFNYVEIRETQRFFRSEGFSVRISLKKNVSLLKPDGVPDHLEQEEFYNTCLDALDPEIVEPIHDEMRRALDGSSANQNLCGGIRNHIAIDGAGFLHPCVLMSDLTLGHALDGRSITTMLQSSPEYLRVRALKKTDLTSCLSCRFQYFCDQCLATRKLETGDYFKIRPQACTFAHAVYKHCHGAQV
jgi:radical SAM protein with 4Fe4S-binding SPASM domain